jgi:large subunit ribosomal protein L9
MQVILMEDIDRLGKRGSIVTVADGYGRNYLIPQRKAIGATPGNRRWYEQEERQSTVRAEKARREAERLKKNIDKLSLTVIVQAGEDDKLFGSVTSQTIAQLLKEQGVEIDRRKIVLEEPLRELGVYTIPIRLHSEVEAQIKLWVVRE